MVSTGALTGIVIELVLSVGFPVGLIIYFSRKHWISWKAVGIGAFVFIFFSQVLEKILHIHMLASLIVLLAVRKKAIQYLIYAILLHAVFDFVPAMYQAKIITSLWIVEGIIVILGILSVFGIMKMKKVYTGE